VYIIDSNANANPNIDSSEIISVSGNKLESFALHFAIRLFFGFAIFFLTIVIYTCNNQRHIVSINQKDSLTGLFNRNTLITEIQNSLISEIISGTYNALFMIDLDGFKQINDNYGHIEGDAVLKKVAVQLSEICKSKDIVGRLGGDEYMIFTKGFSDRIAVEFFAKQISKSISDISLTNGVVNAVSGSIGIAIAPIHGRNFEELYRKSDLALYSAKYNGKNQFCIYSEQLEKQL
jgi:diguanylate cyclase (GGDEF)-like protein